MLAHVVTVSRSPARSTYLVATWARRVCRGAPRPTTHTGLLLARAAVTVSELVSTTSRAPG